ncbi:MAG: hypothetical protein AAF546_12920 [Verrucomicrobiota bacterium]
MDYIERLHSPEFIEALQRPDRTNGPFVVKCHGLLNESLRDVFVQNDHIHASLAIRDPLEIYFSAYDNFRKTGEFSAFAKVSTGIDTIVNYFEKILSSTVATSKIKNVPVIRYEKIVEQPREALLDSLEPPLRDKLMRGAIERFADIGAAKHASDNRFNVGRIKRDLSIYDPGVVREVVSGLESARRSFGYTS